MGDQILDSWRSSSRLILTEYLIVGSLGNSRLIEYLTDQEDSKVRLEAS